jgi:hypothetical protein
MILIDFHGISNIKKKKVEMPTKIGHKTWE